MTHDPMCYLYREDGECNLMADSTPLSTFVDTAPLSTNVDNMTHDPLCPASGCRCVACSDRCDCKALSVVRLLCR